MRRLLDHAFCEYAVQNGLIEQQMVSDLQQREDIITMRETLLLQGHIPFEKYKWAVSHIEGSKLLDSDKSKEFDKNFIEYGQSKGWITQDDINWCLEQSLLSSFSMRELLMVAERIPFEMYKDIANQLAPQHADISPMAGIAETLIDANFPSPTPLSAAPLPVIPETASAETLIDINPLENTLGAAHFPASFPQPLEEDVGANNSSRSHDGAAETLIDQELPLLQQAMPQPTIGSRQSTPAAVTKQHEEPAAHPTDETVDLPSKEEVVKPQPHIRIPSKPVHGKTAATPTPRTLAPKSQQTNQQRLQETTKMSKNKDSDYTVPAELIETLVREVSKEVNLQTQQMSSSIGQSLHSYKLLLGATTFLTIFLVIVIGWVVFQGVKELKSISEEKNRLSKEKLQLESDKTRLVEEKDLLEKEKEVAEKEKESLKQATRNLELQLAQTRDEKDNLLSKSEESLKLSQQEKEKLASHIEGIKKQIAAYQKELQAILLKQTQLAYQQKKFSEALEYITRNISLLGEDKQEEAVAYAWRGLIFQSLKELEKARQDTQKAWRISQNGEVRIVIAEYLLNQQSANSIQKAISMLQEAVSTPFPGAWKAHLKLGDVYAGQKKYANARESWALAVKLNAALQPEVQERLSRLPK